MVRNLAVGAVALLYLCAPGFAADMDPVEAEQLPEYVPSEAAKGWYLRGDATYAASDSVYDFTLLGEDTNNNRFGGGLGLGYRFNDWIRADLTGNFVASDSYDFDNGAVSISANHEMWSGLLTGYVDLGTFAGITPYLGAGAGVLYSRDDFSTNLAALDLDESQTKFAFSLTAGFGYRITDKMTADIGYQFLASPNTQYLNTEKLAIEDGVKLHQIKVGLRFDLY
ncbi:MULTISPECIES: outer membrane protein [Mesorhizobium]|uniref:Porin family protein n=1 Tax=Mesorhizobium denitrificans TaxID=2294114 RepID=A0A371XFN3_9HYPH|nr:MULTISPECIES: outer membrane protein [Mesorhizobium]RFC67993.1 porin family protein [Mesorhizobium denitrificans]